jgi:Asp-tRNA(Asn)/Glu-tRNA(Gln) amidotransferase A subunit family amidase
MAGSSAPVAYMLLAEVAGLIAKRELSPVELTQAMLERIATLDAQLHAYYTVFATEALAAAHAAEAQIRRGTYLGPLHGIPIAVKDIYASGPGAALGRQAKSSNSIRI